MTGRHARTADVHPCSDHNLPDGTLFWSDLGFWAEVVPRENVT